MKKKNVQRALALALAATMLAGTVAGCGKSSDSDSTGGQVIQWKICQGADD